MRKDAFGATMGSRVIQAWAAGIDDACRFIGSGSSFCKRITNAIGVSPLLHGCASFMRSSDGYVLLSVFATFIAVYPKDRAGAGATMYLNAPDSLRLFFISKIGAYLIP